MLSPQALATYRARRAHNYPASVALSMARATIIASAPARPTCGAPANLHGFKACRWIDAPEAYSLRLVGFADKIAPRAIRHKGWYLNEFQDEVARGVVYQTSARRGTPRFLAGLVTPHDGTSGALIETGDTYDDETSAALAADQFAERYAEAEREYQDAWQAGSQWANLADDIEHERTAVLRLGRERRAIAPQASRIRALRAKRSSLLESVRRDTFDAFADGANLSATKLSALTGIRP